MSGTGRGRGWTQGSPGVPRAGPHTGLWSTRDTLSVQTNLCLHLCIFTHIHSFSVFKELSAQKEQFTTGAPAEVPAAGSEGLLWLCRPGQAVPSCPWGVAQWHVGKQGWGWGGWGSQHSSGTRSSPRCVAVINVHLPATLLGIFPMMIHSEQTSGVDAQKKVLLYQDSLWNLWGPVQNENGHPLFKIYEFQDRQQQNFKY